MEGDLGAMPFEPQLVLIPADKFWMGSDPSKDLDAQKQEQTQHSLYLPDYYLARTPVTNMQYAAFVQAVGHKAPDHWKGGKVPAGKEDHPVVYVTWHDAIAYCRWLAETTGKPYRLPTEAEWEKGARGSNGRIYPWGDEWDQAKSNTLESGTGDTTPVGAYPQGASPYGVLDMAGNVWEWTSSLWRSYPYTANDGRENPAAASDELRVLRGGAFDNRGNGVRCAVRNWCYADYWYFSMGFRVACSRPPSEQAAQ